jgi:hypothetical protein
MGYEIKNGRKKSTKSKTCVVNFSIFLTFSNYGEHFLTIFDPDLIVTEESDLHQGNHSSPKTSTDLGIMISIKPVR